MRSDEMSNPEAVDLEQSLWEDVVLRANSRMIEAFMHEEDEELLFQSTVFQGIEVDQIKIVPDEIWERKPRAQLDTIAGIEKVIVRKPTEIARAWYDDELEHPLPLFLMSLKISTGQVHLRIDRDIDGQLDASVVNPDDVWRKVDEEETKNLRPLLPIIREYMQHAGLEGQIAHYQPVIGIDNEIDSAA